jgi:hypothetical protein
MFRPSPEPLCPLCGRADPKLVSQREASHDDPFPAAKDAEETIYVFKCRCGISFIHAVRHERAEQLTS